MSRLSAPLSAAERTAFIARARELLGAPYRHRGRSERGVDCIGLVVYALAPLRDLHDRRVYSPAPDGVQLRDALTAHFGDPVSDLQPGDVVLMRWHQHPNHVALVTDYPTGGLALLHSYAQAKHVVEHRLAEPWPRRIVAGWRP
jgi:cell wall-associated NlpC family hydrolase